MWQGNGEVAHGGGREAGLTTGVVSKVQGERGLGSMLMSMLPPPFSLLAPLSFLNLTLLGSVFFHSSSIPPLRAFGSAHPFLPALPPFFTPHPPSASLELPLQ